LNQRWKRRRWVTCAALWSGGGAALLALPSMAATPAHADVRISGTGSGVGGMRLVAQAFMQAQPDVKVVVLPATGSTGGIRALAAGMLDLALSNRDLAADDLALAPMVSLEYAVTPFVIAVHRNVGLQAASSAQLAALYEPGALYPSGQRARPVMRRSDTTDTAMLKTFSPLVDRAVTRAGERRGMLDAATDADAADYVQNTPGAFSASTLAQMQSEGRPFVALAIDGREPTLANLASGAYPFKKRLFAISHAKPSAAVSRFLAYLRSPAAQAVLRAHGHLPL
jgi:phosphate transport system substrate-binding protein